MNLVASDKLNGRVVKGKINGKNVDLKFDSTSFFGFDKGKITGNIDGKDIVIKYECNKDGIELKGIDKNNSEFSTQLSFLANDKINRDVKLNSDLCDAFG